MGRFATGVVIVTAIDPEGHPTGMTANSLTSVSLQPPLVSICVDHTADMHQSLTGADRFAINILAADQEPLSRRFAGGERKRFDGVGYRRTDSGYLVLDGVLAHLECERHAVFPVGDHTIYVGRVVGGQTGDREPLLYYRGGYAGLGYR